MIYLSRSALGVTAVRTVTSATGDRIMSNIMSNINEGQSNREVSEGRKDYETSSKQDDGTR